jgi:hypothetical protein
MRPERDSFAGVEPALELQPRQLLAARRWAGRADLCPARAFRDTAFCGTVVTQPDARAPDPNGEWSQPPTTRVPATQRTHHPEDDSESENVALARVQGSVRQSRVDMTIREASITVRTHPGRKTDSGPATQFAT